MPTTPTAPATPTTPAQASVPAKATAPATAPAPEAASTPPQVAWEELVTAALLGTTPRPAGPSPHPRQGATARPPRRSSGADGPPQGRTAPGTGRRPARARGARPQATSAARGPAQTRHAPHRPARPRKRRQAGRDTRSDGAAPPVADPGQRPGIRRTARTAARPPERRTRPHGPAPPGADLRRPPSPVAGPPQPGLEVRAPRHSWRRRGPARHGRRTEGPAAVGGGPLRRTGRPPDHPPRARRPRRAGAARHDLADGTCGGPPDVPRLAPHRPVRRGRAVPGTGPHRPQPQRPIDRGGAALRTARLGAGRADGGPGGVLRGRRPRVEHTDPDGRGPARVRRGHGAGRRRRQAPRPAGASAPGGWASWWKPPPSPPGGPGSATAHRPR